jgi:hypothetical protein
MKILHWNCEHLIFRVNTIPNFMAWWNIIIYRLQNDELWTTIYQQFKPLYRLKVQINHASKSSIGVTQQKGDVYMQEFCKVIIISTNHSSFWIIYENRKTVPTFIWFSTIIYINLFNLFNLSKNLTGWEFNSDQNSLVIKS